jgi:hypothetical protein
MRPISYLSALAPLAVLWSDPRLAAQAGADQGPCAEITAACQAAGFSMGGANTGSGLITDCVVPIMQGSAQPPPAHHPLPQIDPQVVSACKASNPHFGQGGRSTTVAPNGQTSNTASGTPPAAPPQATGASRCASGEDTLPNGLVVVLPSGRRPSSRDLNALSNPAVSGVAVQVNWRDLEEFEGQPDWSQLDAVFAAALSAKKWVQLLIFPGFFSPPWALVGAETDSFPIPYGPGSGTVMTLPMPWDGVYLGRWFAFLKLLSDRYGKSPAFRLMAASGPTSVSAEMSLPMKRPDIAKWRANHYSERRYLDAWEKVLRVYADDFPNQCVSLSAPGIPLLDEGRRVNPSGHQRARQMVIDLGSRQFGKRFAIQWSDLHAGHARVEAPDQTDTVIGFSGGLITGLQMRTAAEGSSGVMGAEGDAPLALRKSMDKGLRRNAAGRHINYLEVYLPDVLADEMQSVLRDGAARLAQH